MELSALKIIVSGGASGMGAHFATRLAEAGAQVAVLDINEQGLTALQAQLEGAPGRVHVRQIDLGDPAQIEAAVDWAFEAMGGLNGLVNNAALLRDGLLVKKDRRTGEVVKLSNADWQKVIDVDLTGATFLVRDVVAKMVQHDQGPGCIVNISSTSRHGNPGQSNYVASKAALAANTITWSREFAKFGIRVGAIAPGMVETPMTQGMKPAARAALVERVPLGRIGLPEDIWRGVKFILECDYFTGRTFDIDGGLSI